MQLKSHVLPGIKNIFVLLMLSGCISPVFFEKSIPPEIRTGNIQSSTGFVNRYDYTLPGVVSEKYRSCYQFAAGELARNFREVFDTSAWLKFQAVDTLLPGIARSSPGTLLPADSVISKCKRENVSYLMILESMNFWISGERSGGDEDNSKLLSLKLQDVYLVLMAGISLYNSKGELLHLDSIAYKTIYKTRLSLTSDVLLFEPSLKKSGPSITSLSKDIAEAYYSNFLPGKEKEMRYLYLGKGFRTIRSCIDEMNWDEAIKGLLPLAGSSEPKLARQAAYDLSVLYEIVGNMRQSEFWLGKSGGIKPQEVIKF